MTPAEAIWWRRRALDSEAEEVVDVAVGDVDERVEQLLAVAVPLDVDVLGRPRALAEPQLEREAAFEPPSLCSHERQAGQKPVERDPLAVSRHE